MFTDTNSYKSFLFKPLYKFVMQSKQIILLITLFSFVSFCQGNEQTGSSLHRRFKRQIKIKSPILSLNFREIINGVLCVAHSLTKVKYELFELYSTEDSYLNISGRAAFPGGTTGRVVIGCEVSTVYDGKIYKKWAYTTKIFSLNSYNLNNNTFSLRYSYLQYLTNSNRRNLCVKESSQPLLEEIAKVYCKQLGYANGYYRSSYATTGARYEINCTDRYLSHCEVATTQPNRIYRRYYGYNYYYNNCPYIVRFICSESEISKFNWRGAAPEDLDAQLSIYPDRPIEENDNVTVKCSTDFYPKLSKMISLQRIDSKGEKIDLVTSIKDISFTFYEMSFSFNYIAKRDLIKDTFICSVTDLVSLQSNQIERHLEYKMAFSQINISVYRSNDGGELIDISGQIDQYQSASLLKCEADSEHPMPQYHWFYTAKNGEKMRKTSKQLKLEDVEKRMSVECRVSQQMLSDNFTDSVSLQFGKSINNSQLYEEFSATVGQSSRNKLKTILECSSDEDLLISGLSVGYFDYEIEDVEKCSFKMGAEFIRNEICKGRNRCEISISFMQKPYMVFIVKQTLPSECLTGPSAVMTVNYICLKKIK